MKFFQKLLLLVFFFVAPFIGAAQELKTWVGSMTTASALTNSVPANQMLEIISGFLDSDSSIEVTVDGQMFVMGSGGAGFTLPFVVAGPATVVFRKTNGGGKGLIVTYRTSPATAPGNVK